MADTSTASIIVAFIISPDFFEVQYRWSLVVGDGCRVPGGAMLDSRGMGEGSAKYCLIIVD
jgi:hypothetical protein